MSDICRKWFEDYQRRRCEALGKELQTLHKGNPVLWWLRMPDWRLITASVVVLTIAMLTAFGAAWLAMGMPVEQRCDVSGEAVIPKQMTKDQSRILPGQ